MRRIIVLEMEPRDDSGVHVRYALWANVPAARQPFWQGRQGASFTSSVADGSVSASELTALQSGAVVERTVESEWPPGTTIAFVQSALKQAATDWQVFVNNYNPWARYGTFFDDSTNSWNVKSVA